MCRRFVRRRGFGLRGLGVLGLAPALPVRVQVDLGLILNPHPKPSLSPKPQTLDPKIEALNSGPQIP